MKTNRSTIERSTTCNQMIEPSKAQSFTVFVDNIFSLEGQYGEKSGFLFLLRRVESFTKKRRNPNPMEDFHDREGRSGVSNVPV